MTSDFHRFLGSWRQVEPDLSPNFIEVTFEADGAGRWVMEGLTSGEVALAWRFEGAQLFISREGADGELRSHYLFDGEDVLAIDFGEVRHIYERV